MSRSARVFTFDLDDTLVSEWDYVESGLRAAGAVLDAEAGRADAAGEWLVSLWRRERARDGFQRLLSLRGLEEERWLPRLRAAYRDHAPALQPRPGVPETLTALASRGARFALVSDGYLAVQRRKWASLALPYDFDPVVFTDERGRDYWKPHPWGFEKVMQAHPAASRFIYVADNVAKDFIAPNRLGWTTVMVRHERNLHVAGDAHREAAPALTVDSLSALLELC